MKFSRIIQNTIVYSSLVLSASFSAYGFTTLATVTPTATRTIQSIPKCSNEVHGFYFAQVSYEKAFTLDKQDNVAAEIEAQYDCEIER